MTQKTPLKTGFEYDAIYWRNSYKYTGRAGVCKKAKKQVNRRARREAKKEETMDEELNEVMNVIELDAMNGMSEEESTGASADSTELFAVSDIKQTIYDHGGCSIFFKTERHRQLIASGYQDAAFSVALLKFVEGYYANASAQLPSEAKVN